MDRLSRLTLTIYKLRFHEQAWREWHALDASVREPLKKKLAERLQAPRAPTSALHGMEDCYKIKLHSVGYRMIYRVDESEIFITVIATGKRDKNKVYRTAQDRL